jgi:translocation and assembly module TamB
MSPIPLNVGGSELGNIDGRIVVTENATNAGGGIDLKVNVPHLRVAVPEGSTSSAQSLGLPENVRIGAHRGSPSTFVLLPLDPPAKKKQPEPGKPSTVLAIETNLGDVEVVRGTQLKIDLDGHVNVKAGEKSEVTGQIHLKRGGMLAVKGKNFTVDSGTVTFVDDPANPEIVVKAGWTAPDGTTVYANFVGPLKTGKVTLTSEPKLPQQEIVQLLLFGSSDGQQAQTPPSSTEDSAVGAAGGEAAQPLNHALGQLGLGAVTTNVDTTDSANPKPEVEIQIARALSIQLAIVLGQPLPGVNPDTVLLSLDWRFVKKWTLSSTLGDMGTTIFDLLWQKRY